MQELVGRLSALDPAASESLKIIAYFDNLIASHAGRTALLRAAAVLTGEVAGSRQPGDVAALRVSPDGRRIEPGSASGWPGRSVAGGGRVWIEREAAGHPVDAMVLERLALAVGLLTGPTPATLAATVVDAEASAEDRRDAAERLRLTVTERVRAVALPLDHPQAARAVGTVITRWGSLSVALVRGQGSWTAGPAGIGFSGAPEDLPVSWRSAVVALRARRSDGDVVRADDLGAVVALVEAIDAGAPVPRTWSGSRSCARITQRPRSWRPSPTRPACAPRRSGSAPTTPPCRRGSSRSAECSASTRPRRTAVPGSIWR